MTNEDRIINAGHMMAEAVTSSHFHALGLMDDQVDALEWALYEDKAYNEIMNTAGKLSD